MDGMALLAELRKNPQGKNIKVILLTNLSVDDGTILGGVVVNEPSYYLVKTEHSISDVIEKVKSTLKVE